MLKKGNVVTVRKLQGLFGRYAETVLYDYVEPQERKKKRAQRTVKILKALPSIAEYKDMETKRYTTTVTSLVGDANSEVDSLKEELQSWLDALPENLQSSSKGDLLNESISALENIETFELPAICETIEVVFYPSKKLESRADRASEAGGMFRAAADAIEDFVAKKRAEKDDESSAAKEPPKKASGKKGKNTEPKTVVCDLEELELVGGEVENAATDVEGIEFPGMFS